MLSKMGVLLAYKPLVVNHSEFGPKFPKFQTLNRIFPPISIKSYFFPLKGVTSQHFK